MIIKNKKNIILISLSSIVLVSLIIIGAYLTFIRNNEDNTIPTQKENTDQIDSKKDGQSADNDNKMNPSDTKTSNTKISQDPVVFTSSGHMADKPIKYGQIALTSCTSSPRVSCKIVFTSNGDSITLPSKITDSEGTAFWEWIGGKDVGSGQWSVKAIVDKLSSAEEIIYVE